VGALTSVTSNPGVNSVGASGAIFGILGALIAAQMRSDGSIPKSVLQPLRNSSLIFTGCTLFAGLLSSKVDNAAHLGGVAAGFLIGLAGTRPITGDRSYSRRDLRRFIQLVPVATLVLAAAFWLAQRAAASMVGEELYQRTAHWIVVREPRVNSEFNAALSRDSNNKQDHSAFIETLERDVIPFWREAGDRLAAIQLSSNSPNISALETLQDLSDGRAEAYQLLDDGLRKKDPKVIATAGQELEKVEQAANERRRTGQ
jgi:rhomboid protease GluP